MGQFCISQVKHPAIPTVNLLLLMAERPSFKSINGALSQNGKVLF
jgi:hypothetical protein